VILDDLLTYLAAQSTALTVRSGSGGNLSISHMPDSPDTAVTIYETPGASPIYVMSTSGSSALRAFEQPRVQVISRSSSYQTARTNADTVFDILDGYVGTLPTATGTSYLQITAVQSPFSLGRDENGRYEISCNYEAWRVS
jgi:hypothetical protein